MKADNLFRFVAIRPPDKNKRIVKFEGFDASAEEIIEHIKAWYAETGVLGKALLRTGRDVIYGKDYYTTIAPGRALVVSTEKMQALLQTGASNLDLHDFQNAGLKLLAPINPGHLTLDKLLDSKEYQMVKRSFWRSYYASVLNPYERPQDREEIVSWLLLFHLLESENEAEFKARVEHLGHTRPAVPYAFFAQADESQRLLEAPLLPVMVSPQPEVRHLKDLEARIASLQNARHMLQDLFVTKLRTLTITSAHPSIEQPIATAEWMEVQPPEEMVAEQPPATAEQPKGQQHRRIAGTSFCSTSFSPGRVTDEDLDVNAQAFQLVRNLGLIPEMTPLPNLINQLDSEIATLNAEASRLKTRDEIMLVGKTLVKVGRPLFDADDVEDMR